jgi:hypothetical protein
LLLTVASQIVEYELTVRTGSEADAGTDVPVTFTLFGSSGKSVSLTIDPALSATAAKPFRPSSLDSFTFKDCSIGVCQRVVVALACSGGLADSFYLAQVTVASSPSPLPSPPPPPSPVKKFICNSWLGGGRCSVTLYPEDSFAYEVIIRGSGVSIPPPQ